MGFRGLVVFVVCLALIAESEGFWRRIKKGVKRVVKGAGRVLKQAGRAIKKGVCKVGFGFVCPGLVGTAGAALSVGTKGVASALVKTGVVAGAMACKSARNRCKRSADMDLSEYVFLPYSHHFEDFDTNGDKLITFEEFEYSIMTSIPLDSPEDLNIPFIFADANEDGVLDTDEFIFAPFVFDNNYEEDFSSANSTETAPAA